MLIFSLIFRNIMDMEHISNKKTIHVVADSITGKHIKYTCPVCYTKRKKDGSWNKRSKRMVHMSGSNGDLSNRVEHRTHWQGDTEYADVYITINDLTQKK